MEHVKADVYAEIFRRAMHGVQEPIVQKGEQATMADGEPAWVTKYDNRLLMRLASRLDPNWSERRTIDHNVTVNPAAVMLEPADFLALTVDQQDQLYGLLSLIQVARGDAKALEYSPGETVDADFEEVSEPEDDGEDAIPY